MVKLEQPILLAHPHTSPCRACRVAATWHAMAELERVQPGGEPDLSAAIALLLQAARVVPASYYLLALAVALVVFLYRVLECHVLGDILRGCRGERVQLTFHQASHIYHGVAAKCRIIHGRYLATPWLASPHLQTTFLTFFGNAPAFKYTREIFRTIDGGSIALDWLLASDVIQCSSNMVNASSTKDNTPIVVIIPGLTSDSVASYMRHLAYGIAKGGWNAVVSNHRGLGGISLTSDRFYNAGWTEDLRAVIKHLHQEYPNAPLFAIGTSVGANVLVKYLGEEGENTPVAGATAICSPWDFMVGGRFIRRKLVQRIYDRAIATGLRGYAQMHQPFFSRLANWEGIKKSQSIRDFDNHATRLVSNYQTVDAFYRQCGSASYAINVSVPLLCISCLDDPVCTTEAIPWDECRANKNIVLATTTHGGHLAFFQGLEGKSLWWVGATMEFLHVLHSSPYMHRQKQVTNTAAHSTLESHIDKAPYVNVAEDGMLSNEEVITYKENPHNNDTDQRADATEPQNNDPIRNGTPSSPEPVQESSSMSLEQASPKSGTTKIVAPVKKSLHQLSHPNSKSMWLLAYIAIVTTWPLVGSALLIVLRRKLKNVLPPWLYR